MRKKGCVILDIRSSSISVVSGVLNFKNEVIVTGHSETNYAGFCNGQFLEPDALRDVIGMQISNIEQAVGKVRSIVVGVPSEFCACVIDQVERVYPKQIRVRKKHLYDLLGDANKKHFSDEHDIISINEISYNLEGSNGVIDPIGCTTSRISLFASFILAENSFIDLISKALYDIGINDIRFVPTPLAIGTSLIDESDRERGVVILDIDEYSVSVSAMLSYGLVALKTFMSGNGFVANDLSKVLNIPISSAKELQHKAVLSLKPRPKDTYSTFVEDSVQTFPCDKVNNIISSRIDSISDIALSCIASSDIEYTADTKVFITGSLVGVIGAVEQFEKSFNKKLKLLVPSQAYFAKPYFSSALSILDYALKNL